MAGIRNLVSGMAAGAAGTTALNAVTYLDMAVRARPASEAPQKAVEEIADRTGQSVPGDQDSRDNRVQGLGPLVGILTGVGVGAMAGVCRPVLVKLPAPLAATLIGLTAMALSDGPLVSLRLTDPKQWSKADWVSDLVPHLVYGATTYATLQAAAQ